MLHGNRRGGAAFTQADDNRAHPAGRASDRRAERSAGGPARHRDHRLGKEITASVKAREIRIEQEGPVRVELRVDPGSSDIAVERSQPAGASSYRNLAIDARLAGWLSQDGDVQIATDNERSTGEPPR